MFSYVTILCFIYRPMSFQEKGQDLMCERDIIYKDKNLLLV